MRIMDAVQVLSDLGVLPVVTLAAVVFTAGYGSGGGYYSGGNYYDAPEDYINGWRDDCNSTSEVEDLWRGGIGE